MVEIIPYGEGFKLQEQDGFDNLGRPIYRFVVWYPEKNLTEAEFESELEQQKLIFQSSYLKQPSKVTFSKFADEWLTLYAKQSLKERTIYTYQGLKARVDAEIGNQPLKAITPKVIQEFILKLEQPGANLVTGGRLSAKTIRNYWAFISSVMSFAVKMEVIERNPCQNVILPRMRRTERVVYTLDQAKRFLTLLSNEPLTYQVFFYLVTYGGYRRGEVMGLEWSDINFETHVIALHRTSLYSKEKGIYTDTLKTDGSERVEKLPTLIFNLLWKFYQRHQEIKKNRPEWNPLGRLFVNVDGNPMHPNTPYSWLDRFCKRTGMPHVSVHSFRHLNATLLIGAGVDPKTVSSHLGHTQVSTTLNIYAHEMKEAKARVSEAIANALPIDNMR